MTDTGNTALIDDIARDVLADIAPQEVPMFTAVSKAYFADPGRALKKRRSGDAALGFGVDPLSILFTPIVLHILSELLEFLTDVAKKAVAAGLAHEVQDVMQAMFKRFALSRPPVPSPLGKAQLEVIHAKVLLAARNLQLPEDKVEAIANAVTAQLVISR
jgi:hypothetical protein